MGFLKFLKRDKQKEALELDLPPAPPSIEGFGEEHDILPGLEDAKIGADESNFDFSKDMDFDIGKPESPQFPEFPELEEDKPAQSPPPAAVPLPKPAAQAINLEEPEETQEDPALLKAETEADYQKVTKRFLFPERRHAARQQTFVRVDRFKSVLDNISSIRSNLRKSDEALLKLEHMKSTKDRAYDKIRASLDDLQKKLIFIDKILFKGE